MAGTDDFGSRLRLMREAKGLSVRELGEAAGVSKAYLVRCETGHPKRPNVTLAMVERLAAALGVSPAWLAFGRENRRRAHRSR